MKNNLTDLNNHLFAQLERLSDETLTSDKLETEIKRSDSIIGISKEVVSNASLQLSAVKLKAEYQGMKAGDLPTMLSGPQQ